MYMMYNVVTVKEGQKTKNKKIKKKGKARKVRERFKFNVIYKKDGVQFHDCITEKDLEYANLLAKEEIQDREDGEKVEIISVDWYSQEERSKAILVESGLTLKEAERELKRNTAFIFESFEDFFSSDEFLFDELKESGKTEQEFLKDAENIDVVEFEGKKMVIRFVV